MKTFIKSFSILSIILFSLSVNAQVPNGINYQAIVRDVNGAPIVNQKVGLRFTISTSGTTNYQETAAPTSNSFGLVTYVIGTGTPVTGTFANIPWAAGTKSLQVEMDPAGGTSYTINMGVQPLESVPYSFLSKYTSTISNLPVDSLGNVKLTGVTAGNILVYNGSKWTNTTQWLQSGTNLFYNAGNIGIGTNAPSYPLHISTSSYPGIQIDGSNASWSGMYIRNTSTGNPFYGYEAGSTSAYHYLTSAGAWILYNGGPNFTVLSTGNVGIGTTTPSSTLQVNGKTTTNTLQVTTSPTNGYVLTSDASGNAIWQAGNPKVAFSCYPTTSMTITTTSAQVPFAGETFDDGNNVTSGVFTAPVAGIYVFDATILAYSIPANTRWALQIFLNGVQAVCNYELVLGTDFTSNSVHNVMKLSAGDKVSIQSWLTTGTGTLYTLNSYSYFTGYQLY